MIPFFELQPGEANRIKELQDRQAELTKVCGDKEIADQIFSICGKSYVMYFTVKNVLLTGQQTPDEMLKNLLKQHQQK